MKTKHLLNKTSILFLLLTGLCIHGIAQNCNPIFSITANSTPGNYTFKCTANNPSTTEYHWSLSSGGTIGYGSPINHQFTSNGFYIVCLTAFDSTTMCSKSLCDTVIVTNIGSSSGINQANSFISQISVYPHPLVDVSTLNLNATENSTLHISLYEITGKFIFQNKVNVNQGKNKIALNTEELAQGVYLLSINDSNNKRISTIKLVK